MTLPIPIKAEENQQVLALSFRWTAFAKVMCLQLVFVYCLSAFWMSSTQRVLFLCYFSRYFYYVLRLFQQN